MMSHMFYYRRARTVFLPRSSLSFLCGKDLDTPVTNVSGIWQAKPWTATWVKVLRTCLLQAVFIYTRTMWDFLSCYV